MSNVISIRDLQDMVREGRDVKNLPADAIITPSARDFLHDLQMNGGAKNGAPAASTSNGNKFSPPSKALTSKSPKAELPCIVAWLEWPKAELCCPLARLLAPNAEVSMFPWKEPKERIPLAVRQIRSFLRAHRPAATSAKIDSALALTG